MYRGEFFLRDSDVRFRLVCRLSLDNLAHSGKPSGVYNPHGHSGVSLGVSQVFIIRKIQTHNFRLIRLIQWILKNVCVCVCVCV